MGDERFMVFLQYQCLKPTSLKLAQVVHVVPAKPAGLSDAERPFGFKTWDAEIVPATDTWIPGGVYLTSTTNVLPKADGPWTIQLGLCELLEGKLGGRIRMIKVTDPGGFQPVPNSNLVVLAKDVGR